MRVIAAGLAALALTPVTNASAAYPQWVMAIKDCAVDGRLDGSYPASVLRTAIRKLPSDGYEYTDCTSALQKALGGGSGRPPTPSDATGIVTESGAVAADDSDVAALQEVQRAAGDDEPPIVTVARRPRLLIQPQPGIRHWNELPTSLAVALIALAALVPAWWALAKRAPRPDQSS